MFQGKSLFSLHAFEKKEKVSLNYFLKPNKSMNKVHVYNTKQIYIQLDNPLQLRLDKIKEKEHFFIVEINDRQKLSKALTKYITVLDYADKTFLAL